MATVEQVWEALYREIVAAVDPLTSADPPTPIACKIDWPSEQELSRVARGEHAHISLFDKNTSTDRTRFLVYKAGSQIMNTKGTNVAVSATKIAAGITTDITLSGTPAVGDNIGVGVLNRSTKLVAVHTVASLAETPTTIATALAALINADDVLSTWVEATTAGAVLTLENITARAALAVGAASGSFGSRSREVRRVARDIQVTVWTNSQELRAAIAALVENRLSKRQARYGVFMDVADGGDNTSLKIHVMDDQASRDGAKNDLYRRDFHLECEYSVTRQDLMYQVVQIVPVLTAS